MRLGYSMSYWGGSGPGPADHLTLVREAERLGYDSVWAAETYGTDPVSLMAWLAGTTERIGLGTGVLQMTGRRPTVAAMAAATIDQISGGRFRLGLGPSGPQVVEGWHGVRFERPLDHARDYVAVVRLALSRRPVRHDGPTIRVPLPNSEGKALTLMAPPVQDRLPVYLAAMGEKAIRLAGEVADGWLAIHFPPALIAEHRPSLPAGDRFDVAPMVLTLVEDDQELAYDMMRPMLALYLGGMGSSQTNFYNRLARRLGFEEDAENVQEAYAGGRRGEAMEAVSDELVDAMTICGPAGRVRDRFAAYREAGASTLIVGLVLPTLRLRLEQLRVIAEVAAGL
jgi:F420-dependent oxidoreductase-like protein